jgi:hypothetical protein
MYGNWFVLDHLLDAPATDCCYCNFNTRCAIFDMRYGRKHWSDAICFAELPFMCEKVDHEISETGYINWEGRYYHIYNADSK